MAEQVAADVVVPLERSDLFELLGNLLDNARKLAKHRRVQVGYVLDHIVVEDDGPGVAEAEIEAISQRGRRLDESQPGFWAWAWPLSRTSPTSISWN